MLYLYAPQEADVYQALLSRAMPGREVRVWPEPVDAASVRYAVVWGPPPGFFAGMRRLEAVFVLGAGVDKLMARDDLPSSVAVVRLTDAGMAQQMLEYALYGVLHAQRRMGEYQHQQSAAQWRPLPARLASQTRIGVLGLGEIGGKVAMGLATLGYRVRGWSRSGKPLEGVAACKGEAGLEDLLADSDILLNILPATADTRGLLNERRLQGLPKGAFIINAGRGEQLDQNAVLGLLERGHLAGALLDVFSEEPLPVSHPLWRHPAVLVTPHIAAMTLPEEAVSQITANLAALVRGEKPAGLVERARGY